MSNFAKSPFDMVETTDAAYEHYRSKTRNESHGRPRQGRTNYEALGTGVLMPGATYKDRAPSQLVPITRSPTSKFKMDSPLLLTPRSRPGTAASTATASSTHSTSSQQSGFGIGEGGIRRGRRGSLRELLHASSREIRQGFQIVKMNSQQRSKFYAAKKIAVEREMMVNQQVVQQQVHQAPPLDLSKIHPALREQVAAAVPRPTTTKTMDPSHGPYSLNALLAQAPAPAPATRTAAPTLRRVGILEQTANFVSRASDFAKRPKRESTGDSSMYFSDAAPAGIMDPCAACGRPTEGFLVNGWCRVCLERYRREVGRP